ncbi:hypothetical protein H8959_021095 [Pygathrix nigripes]
MSQRRSGLKQQEQEEVESNTEHWRTPLLIKSAARAVRLPAAFSCLVLGGQSAKHTPPSGSGRPSLEKLNGPRRDLHGEKAVLENTLGAAVLRIPILYGEVEKLEECAVTVVFDKVQCSNKSANMDHWQQRFLTHVKEVATVCRQLAEKTMLDTSIKGTFHWSGNEQMTKYEMACAIADVFNLPSSHLRPITDSPVLGAQRPRNAQLDCSKLETLGIGQRTPFRIGIKESLWPFLIDKRWRQMVFH